MYLPVFEQPEGLRLIVMTGVLILGSLHKRKDVVIADAGASLLVHRRTASADVDRPTEVTRDQIVCVRPPHRNRVVRYFRPAVWQVGPERILVDTGTLGALLAQHAQEDSPS